MKTSPTLATIEGNDGDRLALRWQQEPAAGIYVRPETGGDWIAVRGMACKARAAIDTIHAAYGSDARNAWAITWAADAVLEAWMSS